MRLTALALVTIAAALSGGLSARADGPPPAPAPDAPRYIDWQPTLVGAIDAAKKAGKPLFIAINAEHVDGKSRVEPAGRELREHTYLDPAVVAKSRQFVCAILKPDGTGADYDELRGRFGVPSNIVSPQHIFAHLDGTLIERKEYWSFGAGAASVEALLAMMDAALVAHRAKTNMGAPGATGTPEEQRAAWLRERLEKVRAGAADHAARDVAIQELVKGDQKGDAVGPLCALALEPRKDVDTTVAIVRGLGKPGLEAAVPALSQLLDDSNDPVRGNAAVSLEYVGSATAIDPLTKRLAKEKEELTRNDCCRALGHCGAKQEAVRKTLLREFATSKNNRVSAGPAIGLSYFVADADAARGIEKILLPGVDWQKRAFGLYALTEIRDPKSAEFVREKVLKTEKNQAAIGFLSAVITVLSGTDTAGEAQRIVTKGVESAVGTLVDVGGPSRHDRDRALFTPNGEFTPSKGRGR